MVRTTAWQMARTTARQNPRSRCRQLRGWLDGATSVAAGGPSAAMLTATVRRGVAASDDRKRKTTPNCDLQCFGDPPEPLRFARPLPFGLRSRSSASTGRVDEVGTQRPQPRERPLLIDAGEPTVADDIRSQNSRELSGLAHLPKCEELLCQSRLKECPYLSREGPLQTTPCGRPVSRALRVDLTRAVGERPLFAL
jgi:hypothetical protein